MLKLSLINKKRNEVGQTVTYLSMPLQLYFLLCYGFFKLTEEQACEPYWRRWQKRRIKREKWKERWGWVKKKKTKRNGDEGESGEWDGGDVKGDDVSWRWVRECCQLSVEGCGWLPQVPVPLTLIRPALPHKAEVPVFCGSRCRHPDMALLRHLSARHCCKRARGAQRAGQWGRRRSPGGGRT